MLRVSEKLLGQFITEFSVAFRWDQWSLPFESHFRRVISKQVESHDKSKVCIFNLWFILKVRGDYDWTWYCQWIAKIWVPFIRIG